VIFLPKDGPPYFQGEARADAFSFRAGLPIDRFKGPVEISGTLGDEPGFELRTTGATLRLQGFPLTNATAIARMKIRGHHVDLPATSSDGLREGWCGPGQGDVTYQGECSLTGADLERAIRERSGGEGTVSTGKIDGRARFQVHSGPHGGLRGDGSLH